MKEPEPQVAPVANAAGSPTPRITSSDVQREHRIPPRQVLTRKWPVLYAGSVPDYAYFDSLGQTHQDWRAQWTFRIWGLVAAPWQCNYHEFIALPRVEVLADMHCVTRWSKLGNVWEGVSTRGGAQHRKGVAGSGERHGPLRAGVHYQLAAGRFPRRGLPLCLEAQRPALGARPRLSAAPGRAAALRLEKRQVGPRDRVDGQGPARFLGGMGARGLSHARRSVGGTEVPSAMNVVILGCSYRTAPVGVRERLAFTDEQVGRALDRLSACPGREAVLLGLPADEIRPHLYVHRGLDAVRHLFLVAASLDS